jgi:biopolymer transport protein ExbB
MRKIRQSLVFVLALVVVLLASTPAQAADQFTVKNAWIKLKTWFEAGGGSMWFILGCSVLALAFTLERLIRLQRKRLCPKSLAAQARQLWSQGRYDEIVRLCEQDNSMLARAIKIMVQHRGVPLSDLRTLVGDAMSAELRLHFRRVHPLAVASTVAPLLGLYGTVSGMIGAFKQFKDLGETGDPTVFAGNISLALITTEAGLLVAIPSLAVWHWFRNRTNSFADELESTVQELLVNWFVESAPTAEAKMAVPVMQTAGR